MSRVSFLKKIILFVLVIFSLAFFSTFAEAAKNPKIGASQEWATIDGFRSARFGSSEMAVLRAVKKDFMIKDKDISRVVNQNEKTVTLSIDVNDLFSCKEGGQYFYNGGWNTKAFLAWVIAGVFSIATVWHPSLSFLALKAAHMDIASLTILR